MFHYVDQFFPAAAPGEGGTGYRKLALHFTINDLAYAELSVDARMGREMATGAKLACASAGAGQGEVSARAVVAVNQGGPYGSEVLKGVQEDSDRVWAEVVTAASAASPDENTSGQQQGVAFGDWLKATIEIEARDEGPWTARARKPDGTLGNTHEFVPPS